MLVGNHIDRRIARWTSGSSTHGQVNLNERGWACKTLHVSVNIAAVARINRGRLYPLSGCVLSDGDSVRSILSGSARSGARVTSGGGVVHRS